MGLSDCITKVACSLGFGYLPVRLQIAVPKAVLPMSPLELACMPRMHQLLTGILKHMIGTCVMSLMHRCLTGSF